MPAGRLKCQRALAGWRQTGAPPTRAPAQSHVVVAALAALLLLALGLVDEGQRVVGAARLLQPVTGGSSTRAGVSQQLALPTRGWRVIAAARPLQPAVPLRQEKAACVRRECWGLASMTARVAAAQAAAVAQQCAAMQPSGRTSNTRVHSPVRLHLAPTPFNHRMLTNTLTGTPPSPRA